MRSALAPWLVAVLVAVSAAATADASFPGHNGALVGGGCVKGNSASCGLYVQTAAGERRILSTGRFFVHDAQWSPDASRVAYQMSPTGPGELRVIGADGRGDRLILRNSPSLDLYIGGSDTDWGWTRDGRHLVFVSGTAHKILLIDVDKQVSADAERIVAEAETFASAGWYPLEVAASPVADRLAVRFYDQRGGKQGIGLVDPDGANFRQLLSTAVSGEEYWGIEWAPDGNRLAYLHTVVDRSIGKGTTRPEWISVANPTDVHTLVDYPKGSREAASYVEAVEWSPDGQWIAFKSVDDMTPKWEVIRADGTGRAPFGARYGTIDWQPCSSACSTPALPGMTVGAQKSRLVVKSFTASGSARAGLVFTVFLIAKTEEGVKITHGKPKCAARIGKRALGALAKGANANGAFCTWRLPAGSQGNVLSGSIGLTAGGASVSKSFTRRVGR